MIVYCTRYIIFYRELQGPEYKTNTGVGSPAWMAPEVVLAEYKDISGQTPFYDKKIDVWSVGKFVSKQEHRLEIILVRHVTPFQ